MTTLVRLYVSLISAAVVCAQTGTLGLNNGFLTFNSPSFTFQLVKDSQTAYSFKPSSAATFDYIPRDKMTQRQFNGNYHLGDLTFRARAVGATAWISGDTAVSRKPVTALPVSGTTLASANLAPTLPSNSPLNVTRRWVLQNDVLSLFFDVTPSGNTAVEIGAIGAPLEFNNIFTDRTAANTNANCSLFDPYIGQDAGYVQVLPLLGTLPPLVVTPSGKSPLEGWRFLQESTSADPFYQSQTFEGLYEWQFHTAAYASNEWKAVTPWNSPTSETLQPKAVRTYGLDFRLAPSVRAIESTLQAAKRPVVVGIPGFIVPQDQTAKLFINYPSAVQSISVTPSGALTWTTTNEASNKSWTGYSLTPHAWGRTRLSITYADGTIQTVHYYLTNGATQVLSNLGNFLTTKQWFTDTSDPFKRAPSVISYDREVNAIVKNDPRVWIAGLSDEAGAGSWLAATMKQSAQPNANEVALLETFIAQTLFGTLQFSSGSSQFGVKKSVFFYQPSIVSGYTYPSSINWGNWWSWNQAAAFAVDRAYDYVHVAAAYHSLYRVARNYPSLVKTHDWRWYINQAFQTVMFMTNGRVGFSNDGLMGETVFRVLLDDLKREGLSSNVTAMEARMKARADIWKGTRYPFGSEMAWDSTGQEGVYAWSKYFNNSATATNTLNSILGYMSIIPHWGYNGNARRYWDNVYGGKLMRIERQIHHYGSGLNAIPLLSEFQATGGTDYYLLRLGYGGASGPLSNIDQDGFASASFHSFADTLKWDGYSGDYGPNFVGHVLNVGTFIINHPDFGWQAFGGNVVSASSTSVQVQPRDSVRRKIFVAPFGLLLNLDAGAFSNVVVNPTSKSVQVTITSIADGATNAAAAPQGRLVISQPSAVSGIGTFKPSGSFATDAGAFVVPFASGQAVLTITT